MTETDTVFEETWMQGEQPAAQAPEPVTARAEESAAEHDEFTQAFVADAVAKDQP